jgi:hypothetical protein
MELNIWLKERKKYITGTDITLIMNYLIYENQTTYGNNIFSFSEDKARPKETSSFQNMIFRIGHLEEACVFEELKLFYGFNNVTQGISYIKNFIRITQDIEVKTKGILYEVKTTHSQRTYETFLNKTHPAYFQICAQLYCNDNINKVFLRVIPVRELNNPKLEIEINRNSYLYKIFINHIPILKQVHEEYMKGKEYFIRRSNVSDDISIIIGEIHDIDDKIEELKLLRRQKQDLIIQYSSMNSKKLLYAKQFNDNDSLYLVNIITKTNNIIDEKYKTEYSNIFKYYKNLAIVLFTEKYPSSLQEKTISYIIIKDIKIK